MKSRPDYNPDYKPNYKPNYNLDGKPDDKPDDKPDNPIFLREKRLDFLACSLVVPDLIFCRIILRAEIIVYQADLACLL